MNAARLLFIAIVILVILSGIGSADRGIGATPESVGITTSTTIIAEGNFESHTEFAIRTTDNPTGLSNLAPLGEDAGVYEAVYTEDTQSSGTGIIRYDKELDIETSGQITGQWNVEAVKQLTYVGIDGGRVYSADYMMIDGAARSSETADSIICPFASDVNVIAPAYCNRAEAGSTIDMSVANVQTVATDRFIVASGDHPVELNYWIRVLELEDGVPSRGSASAFLEIIVHEGSRGDASEILMERLEFSDVTTVDGEITTFDKRVHYEAGLVR